MKFQIVSLLAAVFLVCLTNANPTHHHNDDEGLLKSFAVGDYHSVDHSLLLESSKLDNPDDDPYAGRAKPYFLITYVSTASLTITSSITSFSSCYSTLVALPNCTPGGTTVISNLSGRRRKREEEGSNIVTLAYKQYEEETPIKATRVQQKHQDEVRKTAEDQHLNDKRARLLATSTTTVTSISSVLVLNANTQTVVLTTDAAGNGCFPSDLFSSQSVTAC